MSAPLGSNASSFPILSRHWPGFPPVEHVDEVVNAPPHIRDLRLRRDVEKLCRLGARPIHNLLKEIGSQRSCMSFVEDRAPRYAELDPAVVRELGGDRFAGLPGAGA